jgi:hypothetical protein
LHRAADQWCAAHWRSGLSVWSTCAESFPRRIRILLPMRADLAENIEPAHSFERGLAENGNQGKVEVDMQPRSRGSPWERISRSRLPGGISCARRALKSRFARRANRARATVINLGGPAACASTGRVPSATRSRAIRTQFQTPPPRCAKGSLGHRLTCESP